MKVSIRSLVCLCLPMALALGCTSGPPKTMVRLPSGNKILVFSEGPMYFSQSDPALMLKYQTALSLSDKVALQNEADEIWTKFQPEVEKGGFHHAILSANDKPKGFVITSNSSYNFVYDQAPDGSWHLLADQKKP